MPEFDKEKYEESVKEFEKDHSFHFDPVEHGLTADNEDYVNS